MSRNQKLLMTAVVISTFFTYNAEGAEPNSFNSPQTHSNSMNVAEANDLIAQQISKVLSISLKGVKITDSGNLIISTTSANECQKLLNILHAAPYELDKGKVKVGSSPENIMITTGVIPAFLIAVLHFDEQFVKSYTSGKGFIPGANAYMYAQELSAKLGAKSNSSSMGSKKSSITNVQLTKEILEAIYPYFASDYADKKEYYFKISLYDEFEGVYKQKAEQAGINNIVVPRPGHGLAHGMRQGFLALAVIDVLNTIDPNTFSDAEAQDFIGWVKNKISSDPNFKQKIQIASSFQRSGRENEAGVDKSPDLYKKFEKKDAGNFLAYAENNAIALNIFKDKKEITTYALAILKESHFNGGKKPNNPEEHEAYYIGKILWCAHILDLGRIRFMSPAHSMARISQYLFGEDTAVLDPGFKTSKVNDPKANKYSSLLWKISQEYLKATGESYMPNNGINYAVDDNLGFKTYKKYAVRFFTQWAEPNTMITALLKAKKEVDALIQTNKE